jgi:DNA-binding response OmpR family regulator
MRVLIIEDNPALGKALKAKLEAEAYAVDLEGDGDRGSYLARSNDYDAIVLDDILPGKHGSEICRELRAAGRNEPILLMSVQAGIDKKVALLNEGADDYIAKPFSFEEMSARLRALLRRPRTLTARKLQVADLMLDEVAAAAFRDGKRIDLTTKEFVLLAYLMQNAGCLVSRAMILEHVWNDDADQFSKAIETHIHNLRSKIAAGRKDVKRLIHTVSGRGYILEDRGA